MKIIINRFDGGQADSRYSNAANQFALGAGLNISTKGLLKVNQALKAKGTQALYELAYCGGVLHGYYGDKFYKFVSNAWAEEHTNAQGNIYNTKVWQSTLVYATNTYLGKSTTPFSSWADNAAALNNTVIHPILPYFDLVYVGNKGTLAKYDLTTFTDDILPIEANYYVHDLIDYGNYILIALNPNYSGQPSKIYFWDTYSEHFNYSIDVPRFIECFGKIEGRPVVFYTGDGGFDFISPSGLEQGDKSCLIYEESTPAEYVGVGGGFRGNAIGEYGKKMAFGIRSGTTAKRGGVWTYGRKQAGQPLVRNWEWRIPSSTASDSKAVYSIYNPFPTETQAESIYVCVTGDKPYEIDTANKYANAFYESLILDAGRPDQTKLFKDITITTYPLPANCSIAISKKVNEESSWVSVGTYSGTGKTKKTFAAKDTGGGENIQLKLVFTISGNTAPIVRSLAVEYSTFYRR